MKKRLFLLCLLFLIVPLALMAQSKGPGNKLRYKAKSYGIPAWPYPIDYTQPDGSKFTYYLKGDGAVHWRETIDGYPITKNEKGFFEYVRIAPDKKVVPSGVRASAYINMRNANERSYLNGLKKGIPYSPDRVQEMRDSYAPASAESEPSMALGSQGTMNLLLLLVEYPDAAHTHDPIAFDSLMNHDNYHGTGSFKDYYYENSYGDLFVVTTVSVWYMAPQNHDYYGDVGDPELKLAQKLVRDIVDSAEVHGMNFSPFDNDGDNYVDGIMVIHQGIGAEHGDGTCIWSHSWGLNEIRVQYDGVWIQRYTINPEERPDGSGGTVMNGIGTACHEFGHNLGLPDFYDTDYGSSGGQSEHLGYWDCMASGSYNNSSNTPAHHNAYSKELLSWLTISTLNSAASVSMRTVEQEQTAYKYYTTTANEYFLMENRQQVGFDAYIPGHGLLIYHVDQNYIDAHEGYINADPSHQGFDLEEADYTPSHGLGDAFPGTSAATFFNDATTPNSKSWAGANTNKPVSNIQESSQVIHFDFMGGSSSPSITNVVHIPSAPSISDEVQVRADIVDNGIITSTVLKWCTDGTSFGNTIAMSNTSGNIYQTDTDIPPHSVGTTVSYRIEATDDNSETTITPIYSYTVVPPSYCDAGADNDYQNFYINRVRIGTIDNPSGEADAVDNNYEDFTSISTDVNIGTPYSFTINVRTAYDRNQIIIWIDWNGDYDFDDTGEEVYVSGIGGTTQYIGSITPPVGAKGGNTRMRIRYHYNGGGFIVNTTPCGNTGLGEVEDYTIKILTGEPLVDNVTHIPANPTEINSVSVEADITDGNGSITSALLKWCTDGILFNNTIDMSVSSGDTYKTNSNIPFHTVGTTVFYNISATDNDNKTTETVVYSYTVITDPSIAGFPYAESFESGFGKWIQLTDDDFNWTRDANGTPTSSTGPGSAQDGTWYIYTEASNPNYPNKKANIQCIFDLRTATTPRMSFYYHMYGLGMGTLEIKASINTVQWTTLFSKSGDQGNAWFPFEVDISQFAGEIVYMQILGTTGPSNKSDMALDNIVIDNFDIEFVKGPFLQKVTDNSIVIMWETGVGTDSRVDYGISAPNENNVQDASLVTIHEMQLTGLTSDTRYYYTVTSNGTKSATYTFSTAPAVERNIRFAAYGDIQRETPIHGKIVQGIKSYNPEFVFHTGDMVDSGKVYIQWGQRYFNKAQTLICSTAFFPVLGNHEYWPTSSSNNIWFDEFFSLPNNEEWYAYTYSNTRFIGLNTNASYSPGSDQRNWLISELQSTEFNNATWHIVYFHEPPFTASNRHGDNANVKSYLVPLFEQYGVDMVFSGHSHVYERYYNNGIYYFVIGGGGQELDELITDTQEPIRQVGVKNYHYCIFDINIPGQSLTLSVRDTNGTQFDSITLVKHTVSFVAGANGSITGNLVQKVKHGGNCTEVTAVPDAQYLFTEWTGDYAGIDNPLTITNVTTDMTVNAHFAKRCSITVSGIDNADVFLHATNGWQGIKKLDGNGTIAGVKPGVHFLQVQEPGKRTELVSVTVSEGSNTPVVITLKDAIPYIFTARDTIKTKSGVPVDHDTTHSTVMDDINRDGYVDLVVATESGYINYYLNNDGFVFDKTVAVSLQAGEGIKCVRCADLNADGVRELVVGLNSGKIFTLNMAGGNQTLFYTAFNGLTGFDLFAGNSDGFADLLLGYADGTIDQALSSGSGTWNDPEDLTLPGGGSLNVGENAAPLFTDIDGDGVMDIIVGNKAGEVRWFKGNGTLEYAARGMVNSSGRPLATVGKTTLSSGYATVMNDLPFIIVTDSNGNAFKLQTRLLGDIDNDDKVFIKDFSVFVESWGSIENGTGWNWNANFDLTPNGNNKQEIDLTDFTLFNDSWRKVK